jgi:hypothetical protein
VTGFVAVRGARTVPQTDCELLQTVEQDEPGQREQVCVVTEDVDERVLGLLDSGLADGEFRKEMDEHVRDGDAATEREPPAPRDDHG